MSLAAIRIEIRGRRVKYSNPKHTDTAQGNQNRIKVKILVINITSHTPSSHVAVNVVNPAKGQCLGFRRVS